MKKHRLKNKFLLAGGLATIAVPLAAAVSCGESKDDFIKNNIVWYYRKSQDGSQRKIANLVAKNYKALMEKALKSGKLKSRVNLVVKESFAQRDESRKMRNVWGYKNKKSPDIYEESGGTMPFVSGSSTPVFHQFTDTEYKEWADAMGITKKANWNPQYPGKGKFKGQNVRFAFPSSATWANLVMWQWSDEANSKYDATKNDRLSGSSSPEIRLSNSQFTNEEAYKTDDIDMETTYIPYSSEAARWTSAITNSAITEYLLGTPSKPKFRLGMDGNSRTQKDFYYLPNSKSLAKGTNPFPSSILFSGDRQIKGKNQASQFSRAWATLVMNPMNRNSFSPSDRNGGRFGTGINSIGFTTIPSGMRTWPGDDPKNARTLSTQIFFGSKKRANTNEDWNKNYKDTADNNHRFKTWFFNGARTLRNVKYAIEQGVLQSSGKPNKKRVEEILSHINVYRLPKHWVMDQGDETNIKVMNTKSTNSPTNSLDGTRIPSLGDNEVTKVPLVQMVGNLIWAVNKRNWEMKDKAAQENKQEAMKILLKVLQGDFDEDMTIDSADEKEYVALNAKNGIFLTNERMAQLAMPKQGPNPSKSNNWGYKDQTDRITAETIKAMRASLDNYVGVPSYLFYSDAKVADELWTRPKLTDGDMLPWPYATTSTNPWTASDHIYKQLLAIQGGFTNQKDWGAPTNNEDLGV